MAPKRPTPQNEPASLSSDEEREEDFIDGPEDDDDDEEEVQETETKTKKQDSESEEEEEEEESEETEEEDTPLIPPSIENKPSVQKPNPAPTPNPQSDSDSDESDSDSESDSDTQQHSSPTASDFTVKPIVSKPIDDTSKPNKPTSKPAAIPLKLPVSKRAAETQQNDKKDSRRKKSKVSNGDDEEKKLTINRLWSEDDEIAILKGMIDYQSKKGSDPYADMGAFHIFIKESLHVDVSKNQLTDKIRRLKKKYQNNAEKGEKGDDPVFSRPHEHKSFELSKKIWGSESSNAVEDNVIKSNNIKARRSGGGGSIIKSNNNNSKKSGNANNSVARAKEDAKPLKDEIKTDEVDFGSVYPQLIESLLSENSVHLSLPKGGRDFVKEKGSLIGSTKAKELEERWKNLQVEEVELFLKKVDLIQEQTKLVLNAVKASNS